MPPESPPPSEPTPALIATVKEVDAAQTDAPEISHVLDEAEVDDTLDIVKDESDAEVDSPERAAQKPETAHREPSHMQADEDTDMDVDTDIDPTEVPRLADSAGEVIPATPSMRTASEPEDAPLEDAEEDQDMEADQSSLPPMTPPRRTLGEVFMKSPHYRHTSPPPPRPPSPEYGDLELDPHDIAALPSLDPLFSPYALSLYPLPPGQSKKSQRSDKKKDKDRKGSQELQRFHAQSQQNAAYRFLRRSNKCLSTWEWSVGFQELRFVRAMAIIERMKQMNQWSFRQPKKSKGPTLVKVHWDYMLDEMVSDRPVLGT